MAYQDVAKNIIKESIKTAVYIDENALEAYEKMPETPSAEQALSVELTKKLRESNIDLTVFKYEAQKYKDQKNYVFANKDLVLLDWELDGEGGGGLSALNVLHDIISLGRIHCCVIYTRNGNVQDIITRICLYNSGQIFEEYKAIEESIAIDYGNISDEIGIKLFELGRELDKDRRVQIRQIISDSVPGLLHGLHDSKDYFNYASVILKTSAPVQDASMFTGLNFEHNLVVIGSLIVCVVTKQQIQPQSLVDKIYDTISLDQKGFWSLLGLEVRERVMTSSAYIDKAILDVSPEAIAYQKMHKKGFNAFLSDVIARHLLMSIGKKDFVLPNVLSSPEGNDVNGYIDDFVKMNVFYNAWKDDDKNHLLFGDVYKAQDAYYMCISPLCDCAQSKGEKMFYFVTGNVITPNDALAEKESGFISYISSDLIINWRPIVSGNEDSQYITPKPIFVNSTNIVNGNLSVQTYNRAQQSFVQKNFQYITTIKQNYAQRIANFAFTHSTRVGINFAFIDEENNNQGAEALDV